MTQTVDDGPGAKLSFARGLAENLRARVNEERPLLRPRLLPLFERLSRKRLRKRGIASRFIETEAGKIHVFEGAGEGSLPPIVLLHGITSSSAAYGPVIAQLRRATRRIIAVDAPGHGFSERPHVRITREVLLDTMSQVLDRLIDEPAIVVGNSMGGAIALHYANVRPERVRGLVLLSPAGAPWTDDELKSILRMFRMTRARDALAFLRTIYHYQPWFLPLIAPDVVHSVNRPAVQEIFSCAVANFGATPEELASLRMPILLWWGRSERLLPASSLQYFRKHLPSHAIIEEPENIGHCPHLDASKKTSERIVAFARAIDS